MRMFKLLPVIGGLLLLAAACGDLPTEAEVATDVPQFELVDEDQRIDADDVNAHVYGSFALNFDVSSSGGVGVITSGVANFPGNQKNAGTCDDGLWINKQGNRTSGSLDRPHPHCVGETESESQMVVVLEPISAIYETFGDAGQRLQLAAERDEGSASLTGGGDHSRGEGVVVGYAIDASTLGTTNRRVGTLTFDMSQYHQNNIDYFETDCYIHDDYDAPRCLALVIDARYDPLLVDGVGVTTEEVQGFLYWTPADEPFNYDPS